MLPTGKSILLEIKNTKSVSRALPTIVDDSSTSECVSGPRKKKSEARIVITPIKLHALLSLILKSEFN